MALPDAVEARGPPRAGVRLATGAAADARQPAAACDASQALRERALCPAAAPGAAGAGDREFLVRVSHLEIYNEEVGAGGCWVLAGAAAMGVAVVDAGSRKCWVRWLGSAVLRAGLDAC